MRSSRTLGLILIVAAVAWFMFVVLPLAVRACDGTAPEAPQGVRVGP